MNSIRVFPFFNFTFLLKWNKQEIFQRRHEISQRQSPQPATLLKKETLPHLFFCEFREISKSTFCNRTPSVAASERWKFVKPIILRMNFFAQVTGSRVSDHYARNVYRKVFLKIAVLWMLVPSKILHKTINSLENTYNKCGEGLQHGTSPVVSFSGIFLNTRSNWKCLLFIFWLQCVKQEFTLFVSSKNQTACIFTCKQIAFNSNWSINSPRETAADTVLEVSENSHCNVDSEVFSKVSACQHGVC